MPYTLLIFDMDGTLTHERINFAAIREDLAIAADVPILEHIANLPANAQPRAREILHAHELAAAHATQLQEGVHDLLMALRDRNIKTALLTRNSVASTTLILQKYGLEFDHVSTRENPPFKPHADSILNITRALHTPAQQTLMIGDYIYDLQSAAAANVHSVLFCPQNPEPTFANQATFRIIRLSELLSLVDRS